MTDIFDPDRRRVLISLAFTIANSQIFLPGIAEPQYVTWDPYEVDWDDVLGEVINSRNRQNSGAAPSSIGFPFGSPWWCMEEALAANDLLGSGAPEHV